MENEWDTNRDTEIISECVTKREAERDTKRETEMDTEWGTKRDTEMGSEWNTNYLVHLAHSLSFYLLKLAHMVTIFTVQYFLDINLGIGKMWKRLCNAAWQEIMYLL